MKFFYVNNEQCTDCNRCSEACPTAAIYMAAEKRYINYDKCTSCGNCIKNCGAGAISVETIERVTLEMEKIELFKVRIQRLENELSSLKQHLGGVEQCLNEIVLRLPVATLIADHHSKVLVANAPMVDMLAIDSLMLSNMSPTLAGEKIDILLGDNISKLINSSVSDSHSQSHVLSLNNRPVSLSVSILNEGSILLIVRDLTDPAVSGEEIVRRLRETIDRKMSMVQQIGFLLGEDVAVVVNNLNSIIKIVESSSAQDGE